MRSTEGFLVFTEGTGTKAVCKDMLYPEEYIYIRGCTVVRRFWFMRTGVYIGKGSGRKLAQGRLIHPDQLISRYPLPSDAYSAL